MRADLSSRQLEELTQFDTCTVSNAIERLNLRPRNEGFIKGAVECRFPQFAPVAGYAVTARMRAGMMPIRGRCYYEHPDWWRYVASVGGPRIVVIEDVDDPPGAGALFGEAYARIGRALGCIACVTNGAVRDLPGIESLGFQLFAGSVSVSHAYAHVVEFGAPVEIGDLKICSGDLLHGDQHGVHSIPAAAAARIAESAAEVLRGDRALALLTSRPGFSADMLAATLDERGNQLLCD